MKPRFIYSPHGRAGDYAALALNIYSGCTNGCRYCYVPRVVHTPRPAFHKASILRPGLLEALDKDCAIITQTVKYTTPIFLCFTCDPYPYDVDPAPTASVIRTLHHHDLPIKLLTKRPSAALQHLDLFNLGDNFGVSLTFAEPRHQSIMEPHTDPPAVRIASLKAVQKAGLRTWASIEPVIEPAQSLEIIERAIPYVDHFALGKVNHCPDLERQTNWLEYYTAAINLLSRAGKAYTVKTDLYEATHPTPPIGDPK